MTPESLHCPVCSLGVQIFTPWLWQYTFIPEDMLENLLLSWLSRDRDVFVQGRSERLYKSKWEHSIIAYSWMFWVLLLCCSMWNKTQEVQDAIEGNTRMNKHHKYFSFLIENFLSCFQYADCIHHSCFIFFGNSSFPRVSLRKSWDPALLANA